MSLRVFLISGLLLMTGCGEACEIDVPADPVMLFAEARSFGTIAETSGRFSKLGTFRELEGDVEKVECVDQPVNRVDYSYSMNGAPGRLELVFYFGRLAETRFHPEDPSSFLSAAAKAGLPNSLEEEIRIGNRVLWAAGRGYSAETWGASDVRLSEQFQSWIRKRE